jgi:hypothetical protein
MTEKKRIEESVEMTVFLKTRSDIACGQCSDIDGEGHRDQPEVFR